MLGFRPLTSGPLASGSIAVVITGDAAFTFDDVTQASAGSVDITGDAAFTLDALTLSSTELSAATGDAAFTLDDATLSSTASTDIAADSAFTFDDVTQVSAGSVDVAADAAFTLDAVTLSSTASTDISATSAFTLDDVTQVSAGVIVTTTKRGILATLLAALTASPFKPVYLIELGFDSGNVSLWSGKGSLTVNASEIISNGEFDTDTTGWTGFNATLSVVSGQLVVTVVASGLSYAYQEFTTIIGETYNVSVDYVTDGVTGNSFILLGTSQGASDLLSIAMESTIGTFTSSFTATSTTSFISLATSSSALLGETNTFDNASVKFALDNEARTYTGAGILLGLPDTEETSLVVARGVSLTLSGVPSAILTLALTESYQGRSCVVRFGDRDTPEDAAVLFSGEIDTMDITEGPQVSTIVLNAESDLIMLERLVLRTYSDQNQKLRFSGDEFFSFVTDLDEITAF